jgi:UDP-4-amino-4,6-dideoxy-N-acetyl-beta-L-altrosamine transaminase
MKIIPYSRQSINQDDMDAVAEVLRSDWLTQGPKVKEFEDALAWRCGAKHCVAVANGTVALHLACLALEVKEGDVGITSPLSFLASANCIAYCGGRPRFSDIDPSRLCLSPEGIEEYCKTRKSPKVVIPVDFAGVPADLPRFKALSEKYGFRLVEDAAHSIGSRYTFEGREYACGSCSHTDMAILSFHPVKTITTGEGGAILINDDEWAARLRRLANHGIERDTSVFVPGHSEIVTAQRFPAWYHEMQDLGFNARITDIQSALGLSQLKRLDEFKSKRQAIVRKYNEAFDEMERKEIVLRPPWPENTDPCYHLYALRLGAACKISRDDLFLGLRNKGIHCQVHYIPIYRQPYYVDRFGVEPELFPETESYFASCLSLPLFPDLDDAAFDYVMATISSLIQ